jgi:hypothetical protein
MTCEPGDGSMSPPSGNLAETPPATAAQASFQLPKPGQFLPCWQASVKCAQANLQQRLVLI